MAQKRTFSETQSYLTPIVWVIMLGIGLVLAYFLWQQMYLDQSVFSSESTNSDILIYVFPFLVLGLCIGLMKLTTTIDENGVEFRYRPFFIHKVFSWDQIESINVIHYGFMVGYGIRLWTKYGMVYNMKGNTGIFIMLKNGKKLMIGTQKEEEVKEVLLDLKK